MGFLPFYSEASFFLLLFVFFIFMVLLQIYFVLLQPNKFKIVKSKIIN